jgi:uncharacterized protein YdeI (YjbR/CyaY-like superfamily)
MPRKIDEFADFHPMTRGEWRAWLMKNHDSSPGVWFVYYKKTSGKPRVTYDEAVEEGLCFGWIDSLPRKFDDERSKLLFTPRKTRSVWSKPNKVRIAKMIEQNLMTEAGLKKIAAAKKDGSWNALDDSDNLKIPIDLAKSLKDNNDAAKNFNAFTDSVKKTILYWIASAKRTETRTARIEKTVLMAAKNKRANYDQE